MWPRTKENGLDRDSLHPEHLSKRPCTLSPAQRYSPSNGLSHQPNGLPHPTPPPPQHYRLEDMAVAHRYRDTYRPPDPRDLREHPRPAGEGAPRGSMWDGEASRGGQGSRQGNVGLVGRSPQRELAGALQDWTQAREEPWKSWEEMTRMVRKRA